MMNRFTNAVSCLFCLAVLSAFALPAHAVVVFSDNYTAPSNPNTLNLNFNLAGREGGTLGAGGAVNYASNGGNAQVGNPTGGFDSGNYLLNAFGAVSGPNANFALPGGSLTISFDIIPNLGTSVGSGPYISGNSSSWTSLVLSNSATPVDPFVTVADFGILWRGNGNIQAFSNGNMLTNDTPMFAENFLAHRIDAVISNLSGGGSGFAGNGTLITLYADGSAVPFASYSSGLGQIPSFSNLQFKFGTNGDTIGAIDNLLVTLTIPEPATATLGLMAMGGLLVRRRRVV